MTKLCQNCARQFLCKDFKKIDNCNKFLSFIYTKNYGEINKKNESYIEHTEKRVI